MRTEHTKAPFLTRTAGRALSHVVLAALLFAFSAPAWSSGFRNSQWGATMSEVVHTERAKPTAREVTENGLHTIRYAAELLGQPADFTYYFDSMCKRLIGGSLSFPEPLTETQMLMVIRTFSNIYGEGPASTNLNGGHIMKWHDDESDIQFLHLPRGVEIPELEHLPRSRISYWSLEREPSSCDVSRD